MEHLNQIGYELGRAVSAGDCFFDAMAQGLSRNNIAIPAEYQGSTGYKKLREVCNKYAKDNQQDANNWLVKGRDAKELREYLMTVRFTAPEAEEGYGKKLLPSGTALWGRPDIDGRIICEKFQVRLHLLEIAVIDNNITLIHQLIDSNGSRTLSEREIAGIYNDERTIHLAVYQNSLHFVPILRKNVKNEAENNELENNNEEATRASGAGKRKRTISEDSLEEDSDDSDSTPIVQKIAKKIKLGST